jgi:hypothetical protein
LALPEEDDEGVSFLPELPEPEPPDPLEEELPPLESDFFSEDADLSEAEPDRSESFFDAPSPEDFDRLSVE